MTEWVLCPKCGAFMVMYTGYSQCPVCGYRIPVQTITQTTGTSIYEYVPIIRCKDCRWYVYSEGVCKLHSNNYEPSVKMEEDDFCSKAKCITFSEVFEKYWKAVAEDMRKEE